MIQVILQTFPDRPPGTGENVLTGSGGAFLTPPWRRRLVGMFGLDDFSRLASVIGTGTTSSPFSQPGQSVVVSGGPPGTIRTQILSP